MVSVRLYSFVEVASTAVQEKGISFTTRFAAIATANPTTIIATENIPVVSFFVVMLQRLFCTHWQVKNRHNPVTLTKYTTPVRSRQPLIKL